MGERTVSFSITGEFVTNGDFLTGEKGWALLHNPGMGVAFVTSSPERQLTRAQREFLYGYYADRGLFDKAEQYLDGE